MKGNKIISVMVSCEGCILWYSDTCLDELIKIITL